MRLGREQQKLTHFLNFESAGGQSLKKKKSCSVFYYNLTFDPPPSPPLSLRAADVKTF